VEDPERSTGRTLVLDQLGHAYVDLADPSLLQFRYVRWFDAALADPIAALDGSASVLHVGGGGFSFPRHLAAVHPASRQTILELDPVVYDVARDELGYRPTDRDSVVIGDARLSATALATDAFDVVVGDAFGGLSVPWHLTTAEFVAEIDRIMRPGGVYVMNLIDGPGLGFVRAEAATLADRFGHVAVVAEGSAFAGYPAGGGNIVLVASHLPLDAAAIADRAEAAGSPVRIISGTDALAAFTAGAPVLRDDFAPVDQLIGR
jgi:spermidine synthase